MLAGLHLLSVRVTMTFLVVSLCCAQFDPNNFPHSEAHTHLALICARSTAPLRQFGRRPRSGTCRLAQHLRDGQNIEALTHLARVLMACAVLRAACSAAASCMPFVNMLCSASWAKADSPPCAVGADTIALSISSTLDDVQQ